MSQISSDKIRPFFFVILLLIAGSLALQGFKKKQDNFLIVSGKALYDTRQYSEQTVKVHITQDGKNYQNIVCDNKGRFETKILLNHSYIFNFTMDYFETSKVLVETYVPDAISQGSVGGILNFDCEIFERVEGMNYAILNKPLLKLKYYEKSNEFTNDEAYSEKILIDLEAFKDRLGEMKQRRKEVLKEEPAVAKVEETKPKPKRKAIVFEEEKKPPKAENTRGHRNIMDQFNEPDEEEVEEIIAKEEIEETEVIAEKTTKDPKLQKEEEMFFVEEVDESEYISLNIIPKRVAIQAEVKVNTPQEKISRQIVFEKMKRQQVVELKRVKEESKIKERVTSFATRNFLIKEKRLENKKVQNQRLRGLIKTVSLAEVYYKKEYYLKNPIDHSYVEPTIVSHVSSDFLSDTEEVVVKYPSTKTVFRKKNYPFGITYFYIDGSETSSENYCQKITELSKDTYLCAN